MKRLLQLEEIQSWMATMTPLARQVLTNELHRITASVHRGTRKRAAAQRARIEARLVLINEMERRKAWR